MFLESDEIGENENVDRSGSVPSGDGSARSPRTKGSNRGSGGSGARNEASSVDRSFDATRDAIGDESANGSDPEFADSDTNATDGSSGSARGSSGSNRGSSGSGSGSGSGSIRLGDLRDTITDTDTDRNDRGSSRARTRDNVSSNVWLGDTKQRKPRKTKDSDSIKNASLNDTKDLVSVFVGTLFEIPALALKQEFWRLTSEENKAITDALIRWLDTLPKARSNKVAKFLAENLPIINLAFVMIFVVGERVNKSIAISKQTKQVKQAQAVENVIDFEPKTATVITPLDAMFNN